MKHELNIAIYVIDDDESQRILIDGLFKRNDVLNYFIFSDPDELIKALHNGVQICVLDYQLKNNFHTGLTLMKEILRVNSYCKCIIMSGYEDAGTIKDFLNCGAFRYVTKGEQNFDKHLIKYINQALKEIIETYTFYRTVLLKMAETKTLLTEYKDG